MENESGNYRSSQVPTTPAPQTLPSFYDRNRLLIKGFLIGFLILIMLIPAAFISNLVSERADRQEQVIREVSSTWATAQTITGPVLIVPYYYNYKGANNQPVSVKKWAHFLPDELKINGEVIPEVRKRSLYQVMLYKSELSITGRFAPLPLGNLQIAPESLVWSEARLLFGINDARGLQEEISLKWGDTQTRFEAGMPENNALKEGLSTLVPLNAQSNVPFAIRLSLRGSENLSFVPVGRSTEVSLKSTWPHPDFNGHYMHDGAAISKDGFNAHWKILQASRSYPQSWKDGTPDLAASAFGVHLIQPADGYAKTERSVKYAILFIGLTFIVFFFLEILQKHQVHPLQYLLVGFALSIFYTLLLSISEYLGFNSAYLIAALATVSLIGLYTWNVFQSGKTAIGFTIALGGLYSYIFILIQLEDYSLLFGSIGLFLILAVIMYFSRKIDWYGIGKHPHQVASAA
jgi:inner membrane protein